MNFLLAMSLHRTKVFCLPLLVGAALHVQAASIDGHLSGGVQASDDSDGFQSFKPWAQYEANKGWGLRASWQEYRIHGWSDKGRSLMLTHTAKTANWNSDGRIGLNRTAGHTHWIGQWDGMYHLTQRTSAGLSLERDVVDSQRGLVGGLTATSAIGVFDHQWSDRWQLGLAAGSTWFSDDNRRDIFRTRLTLTISEPQGWYSYVSTRNYWNSEPYRSAYFSPDRFREAAWGVMWKHAIAPHIVIKTYADIGRQYIDGQGQHLWHAGIALSAPHHALVQWSVGITTSRDRSSSTANSGNSYRYTTFAAQLRLPL